MMKIRMIGMKKPNHGKHKQFPPKCNPLCKNLSSKSVGLVPYQVAFPSLKKPHQIVDMPIATPQGTLDFKSVDTITFVGASSNTVIDTTTGSLGVGVDGNGPTSNLHVVGNTRLEGDINMLHTSNTASIKLNSNVVTEFPRSKKFIKYPRVALTQNALNNGYTIVQSSAGTSSTETRKAWSLFNGVTAGGGGNTYHGNDGTAQWDGGGNYTGSESLGGVDGVWLYIHLPVKICLEFVKLTSRAALAQRTPRSGTFLGSNDGLNWTFLSSFSDTILVDPAGSSSPEYTYTYDVNSITKYEYIGFVIERIGTTYPNFEELELFGVPEYDPEADGVDVTVKSLPNVPNTDWLEVYYDAKDLADGAVTAVDDLTPSGTNDGTATNVTVSDGAFVFNGTSSLLESSTTITNSTGDIPHTFSLWVKPSDGDLDDTGNHYLIAYGTELNTGKWSGISISNKRFASVIHASVVRFGPEIRVGEWYHIVLNYKSGGIHNSDRFDFFINGSRINTSALSTAGSQAGSATLNLSSPAKLVLGGLFNGSERSSSTIANARLFNRVLTSDEIYQLYAYQREYFGHGDLSMTLKAGRLGIGTSEPKAALDVRGRIMREYNPGEIIETIQGKAIGRYVKVQSGTYLLPNVGDTQDLTSTHTRINGSNFDYTPPPGTTRVIYEFWFFLRRIDDSPILHVAGRVDGSQVNDARHTFRHQTDNIGTDPQIWIYNHMCISIGEVTSDNIAGGQVATWNGPRTIDFSARRYSGSFDARLHKTNHWDGAGSDILVRPTIKITAIA